MLWKVIRFVVCQPNGCLLGVLFESNKIINIHEKHQRVQVLVFSCSRTYQIPPWHSFLFNPFFSEQFVHSCQVRKLGHFLTLFPLQCHQTARHFYWCCQFTSQAWSSTVIASVDKISFFQLSTIVSIIPRMPTGLCEYFQGFWLIDCCSMYDILVQPWSTPDFLRIPKIPKI